MNSFISQDDLRLLELFKSTALSTSDFTHENHIRIAWLSLTKHGFENGSKEFINDLLTYVDAKGAIAKYSDKITRTWLGIIAVRLKAGESWMDFKTRNSDIFTNAKDVMRAH